MARVVVPDPMLAARLAALDRAIFGPDATPWTADDFLALGGPPGAAVIVDDDLRDGIVILRMAADEGEVLNIGVRGPARRQGLGRTLLETAEDLARDLGIARLFLEVAADNDAAQALYDRLGYTRVGARTGYYLRSDGSRIDAFILSKML